MKTSQRNDSIWNQWDRDKDNKRLAYRSGYETFLGERERRKSLKTEMESNSKEKGM